MVVTCVIMARMIIFRRLFLPVVSFMVMPRFTVFGRVFGHFFRQQWGSRKAQCRRQQY
jgi:hypothetical protein